MNNETLRQYFPNEILPAKLEATMDFLHHELGLVVFEKRQLCIPEINQERLTVVFGSEAENAKRSVDQMTAFLKMPAVGDHFGKDHETRRTKRGNVYLRFKEENPEIAESYRFFYCTKNQFKGGRLGLIRTHIALLEHYIQGTGNFDLATRFTQIKNQIDNKKRGLDPETGKQVSFDYDNLESLEDKLGVIHFYENKIIEILSLLSSE